MKQMQFELWQECGAKCSYCYLGHLNICTPDEEKINTMQFDYALESALTKAKCRNNKAIKALLDLSELKYNNGNIEGLESQINDLKVNAEYLFETHQTQQGSGFNPGGTASNKITKDDFRKMNMLQRNELYRKDPQLYEELRK